jgi:hypothetical protein
LAFLSGHEVDDLPPSSAEVKEWVDLYLHSPNTLSWRGAQLGGAQDSFTYLYLYLIPGTASRGSSVSMVTRLRAGPPGFDSQQGQWWDFFSSSPRPDRLWDPPIQWVLGALSQGIKRRGCEADYSPNMWSYTSTPPSTSSWRILS